MNITIGTKVTIKDGSYMLGICSINNTLASSTVKTPIIGLCNEVFTVIAVNQPVPTKRFLPKVLSETNNCIIMNDTTKEIWFCSILNLYLY